jgi:hypothetical protein
MGHRDFLWGEGELLINWKPWKWWQKQQLTFWRRQLILRVKSLFVENFEFKILVLDSEGGIPQNPVYGNVQKIAHILTLRL